MTFVAACLFLGRAAVFQGHLTLFQDPYISGTERMPYQGRFMMMPVVRFLATSPRLQHIHLSNMGPVEVGISFINAGCLAIIGLISLRLGTILGLSKHFYYLPWILTFYAIAGTYCIHQEWAWWNYYDFPGYAFFAVGLWAILEGWTWFYIAVSFIGMWNRETMLLLVPLWVAWSMRDEEWNWRSARNHWRLLLNSCLLAAVLYADKRVAIHLLGFDKTSRGYIGPWAFLVAKYLSVWHWPQILSALGFTLPFVFLFSGLLPRRVWCLLIGSIPGLLVLLWAGVPMENRVYTDFAIVIALALSFEVEEYVRRISPFPERPDVDAGLITKEAGVHPGEGIAV